MTALGRAGIRESAFGGSTVRGVEAAPSADRWKADRSRKEGTVAKGRIGIGVIGPGGISQSVHIPGFQLCDETRVVAAAGRRQEQVNAVADRFGIPHRTTDWREVIRHPEVDAVLIATPPHLHHEIAVAAARAGKHVLCEKPVAVNAGQVEEMLRAAEEARVRHMIAFTFRFSPGLRYLVDLVREGHFGQVRQWRACQFGNSQLDPRTPMNWRHRRAEAVAGALGDMGVHLIDLAHWIVGPIASVAAFGQTFDQVRPQPGGTGTGTVEVEDHCVVALRFGSGALGPIEVSRCVAGRGAFGARSYQVVELSGTQGSAIYFIQDPYRLQLCAGPILAGDQQWATVDVPQRYWRPEGFARPLSREEPLNFRLDQSFEFVRAIRDGRDAVPSFRDGLACQRVLDAILRSMDEGAVQRVPC
jgi:predicted dehydrogenase